MLRFAFLMSSFCLVATSTALAQSAPHLSDQQLEALSNENAAELGPRNWGPPLPALPDPPLHALPVPTRCVSPVADFEPIYAAPSANAPRRGTAAPELAATGVSHGGWSQIVTSGNNVGWLPSARIKPYTPRVANGLPQCVVAGERPNGMVIFNYSR